MKTLGIFLFHLLFFSVAQARPQYVDEPKNCFAMEAQFPCAVQVTRKTNLQTKNFYLRLSSGSSFILKTSREIAMLSGAMYVKSESGGSIKISQASIDFTGELLLEQKKGREIWLFNLGAEVQFPKSSFWMNSEALPAGFENWYAGLAPSGVLQRGVLKPFQAQEVITRVFTLGNWSKEEAANSLKQWREEWAGAVELSASVYQETAKYREIASVEKRQRQAAEAMRAQKEREEIRRLYHEKVFFQ